MAIRRPKIILNEKEEQFIRWMAKRDSESGEKVSFEMEMQMIFQTELDALMDLYEGEFLDDTRQTV